MKNTIRRGFLFEAKKLSFLAVLVVFIAGGVFAQNREDPNPDSDFTVDRAGNTITGYNGQDPRVIFPSHINGRPITAIGNAAFRNNKIIREVAISREIISIGNDAFAGSTLRWIRFDGGVRNIGDRAFANTNLQDFVSNWPGGVRKIPNGLFRSTDLRRGLVIPEGVEEIGNDAFRGTQITSVTLPRTINRIGNYAFSGCTQLTTVTIPSSVTSIIFGTATFGSTSSGDLARAPLNDASKRALTDRGHNGRW